MVPGSVAGIDRGIFGSPQFQKYDKLKITHSGNAGLGTPSAIIRPITPIRPVFDTGLVYTKPIIPAQVLPIVPSSIPAGVPQATYRGTSGLVNGREANILILKQANDQIGNGYVYSFETENGIATQETGSLKSFGPKGDAIVAEGVYRYTAPNGVLIETRYSADENGFRAEGAHLPVGPRSPNTFSGLSSTSQPIHPNRNDPPSDNDNLNILYIPF